MENLKKSEIKHAERKVASFLEKYGMHYADIDIEDQIKLFTEEMVNGLEGRQSSLKMFPTFIEFKKKIIKSEPVIVLDAGGTNLRSAVFCFDGGSKPVITKYRQTLMPGHKNEVSKEEFFNSIADSVSDILHESQKIGFVFSYPIEIFPNKDGKLIWFTKEIKAKEVEGQFIGENLLRIIRNRGYKNIKSIVLLNDTAASLLSGISAFQDREYSSYVGFVLGTGMNACYVEKNTNIKHPKIKDLPRENSQLINIEAGQYLKGPYGKIDFEFNKQTHDSSFTAYEKMFSGAYLGGLAQTVLKYAIYDGLFSDGFVGISDKFKNLESRDIDDYLNYPPENRILADLVPRMSEEDKLSLYFLFDSLIERAAVLSSIVLAASAIKEGAGYSPCAPICMVADGSSFYKMKNFKTRVEYYLDKILSKHHIAMGAGSSGQPDGIYYEIHAVEEAILKGAAAAALA
jgi:hexokinase